MNTGYTKLLVAVGITESENHNEVEIIDLESSNSNCLNLKDYPHPTVGAVGNLDLFGSPVICGGTNRGRDCYLYAGSNWNIFAQGAEVKMQKKL